MCEFYRPESKYTYFLFLRKYAQVEVETWSGIQLQQKKITNSEFFTVRCPNSVQAYNLQTRPNFGLCLISLVILIRFSSNLVGLIKLRKEFEIMKNFIGHVIRTYFTDHV